jgi:hypothetical protein
LLAAFVAVFVAGLIVSATQWFVLRWYIPDWLWILANTAGYVMLMTTLQAWHSVFDQSVANGHLPAILGSLSAQIIPLAIALGGVLLSAACTIWLGLAQWLVLRHYTRPSWGMILVPAIAVFLSSGIMIVDTLLSWFHLNIPVDVAILGAGILGTTQAIALCSLRAKKATVLSENDLLATAPELINSMQVQALARRLHRQLKQIWNRNSLCDRPVTYLLGVTATGTIAAYDPLTPDAIAAVDQTPLPSLVNTSELPDTDYPALARFQVTWTPAGRLKILALRGISLVWLSLEMLILVLAGSAIARYLRQILLGH